MGEEYSEERRNNGHGLRRTTDQPTAIPWARIIAIGALLASAPLSIGMFSLKNDFDLAERMAEVENQAQAATFAAATARPDPFTGDDAERLEADILKIVKGWDNEMTVDHARERRILKHELMDELQSAIHFPFDVEWQERIRALERFADRVTNKLKRDGEVIDGYEFKSEYWRGHHGTQTEVAAE